MPKNPPGLVRVPGRPGYYYRDQRGGKDRLVKLSNDREEAMRRLRNLRGGPMLDPITVKDAASLWMKGAVATRRNERFQRLTQQRIDRHLLPALGMRRLSGVTAEHCRAYRLELESGLSPQSVAHILADLRCMLLWAVDEGLLDRSPFPRRLMPRVQEQDPKGLSADEVKACEALPGADGFECRVLIGSGMRYGEASRALASHLKGGALVIATTKSGKVRRVPLGTSLEAEIRAHVGRLFRFTNAQTLAKRVRTAVPGFSAHRARHTFAYLYLERGGTFHALRELMGHSSVKVTERYARGLAVLAEREARRIVG